LLFQVGEQRRGTFSKTENPKVFYGGRCPVQLQEDVEQRTVDPGSGGLAGFQEFSELAEAGIVVQAPVDAVGERFRNVQAAGQSFGSALEELIFQRQGEVVFRQQRIAAHRFVQSGKDIFRDITGSS